MGCGGSKKAPPPAGACKLTLKNNTSMMADKGFSLHNEKKEKVMELKHKEDKQKDKLQQAVDVEAKSMMDDSLLMYVCTETTYVKDGKEGQQDWGDDLKSGWKDPDGKFKVTGAGSHHWQIELKSIIYADATKSKELASITVKGQGGTIAQIGEDENRYVHKFVDGIKYALKVGGADVPVEHESLKGKGGPGLKLKTDLFTLEWTVDSTFSCMEATHRGSGQTRLVSIHKSGDEAVLGAVLGGVIGMDLLPLTIVYWKLEDHLPKQTDLTELA
jgi:hypothetical protein